MITLLFLSGCAFIEDLLNHLGLVGSCSTNGKFEGHCQCKTSGYTEYLKHHRIGGGVLLRTECMNLHHTLANVTGLP